MEFLSTIAAGLVVSLVTSVLTVRLALSQHYSERWWERRLDAYLQVHDALSIQLKKAKAESDALEDYYAEAYRTGEVHASAIPGDVVEELRKDWRKSERELEDARIRGTFLLSEDAVALLKRYQQKRREIDLSMRDLEQERIEAHLNAAQVVVGEFGELAKKDLRIAGTGLTQRRVRFFRPVGRVDKAPTSFPQA